MSQPYYCCTDCANVLQMYTENTKMLAFCVTIWHSSELCYKEKEICTTWRTMLGANHCRFSCMSGALLWWGEEYWLKLVLEESRDAKSCVSRWTHTNMHITKNVYNKAGALLWQGEDCLLKLVLKKSRDAKFCVSRLICMLYIGVLWWIGFEMGCSWDAKFCVSTSNP